MNAQEVFNLRPRVDAESPRQALREHIADCHNKLLQMGAEGELLLLRVKSYASQLRGLAAQNKELKRSNHQLHVALEKERGNRIHGEGLREQIRVLKEELQAWFEISTDEQKLKIAESLEARIEPHPRQMSESEDA